MRGEQARYDGRSNTRAHLDTLRRIPEPAIAYRHFQRGRPPSAKLALLEHRPRDVHQRPLLIEVTITTASTAIPAHTKVEGIPPEPITAEPAAAAVAAVGEFGVG
jgi:hypothetical protein